MRADQRIGEEPLIDFRKTIGKQNVRQEKTCSKIKTGTIGNSGWQNIVNHIVLASIWKLEIIMFFITTDHRKDLSYEGGMPWG